MSVLASLLVRDRLIPVDRVQQAIQEQVMHGGNLDTVLLELDYLCENPMNAYCAAVYGLLPATRSEVMEAAVGTIRALPREFAVRHRLIPVALTEEAVVLVVDRPLPEATLREIAFELGIDPVQRVVCSVRVEAGLARHYDIKMTSRMRRLSDKLNARDPGPVPYVAPFEGVGKRSSLPPREELLGSHDGDEPVLSASVGMADTEPPPPVVPRIGASVPAGTFRNTDQSGPLRDGATASSGFLDATRYSLPPRPPEVLGRQSVRATQSRAPVATAWRPMPSTGWPRSTSGWQPVPHSPVAHGQASSLEDVETLEPVAQGFYAEPPEVREALPRSGSEDRHSGDQRWRTAPARSPSDPSLPSIIVDLGDEVEQLVGALRHAGPEDEMSVLPLLAVGEAVLPALAREFPGRLWFDRHRPHVRVPLGRDISPISRAFVAFGLRSVAYLIPLLHHPEADTRYYAALLASEFLHPDLVQPVGRCLFDPDPGVRTNAYRTLSVLCACELEFKQLIERLRASARDGRALEPRVIAIEALGRLRDAESFEFFVSLLDDSEESVIRAAHAGLVRLSCQDFGNNKKKWTTWLAKHRDRHRVEWLIDGLTHADSRLRRRAGEELGHLTQEYFGYDPGLSKKERENAQHKYRVWWERVGFRMFVRRSTQAPGQAQSR